MGRLAVGLALLLAVTLGAGCAAVGMKAVGPAEYIAGKRGDILTTGGLSRSTQDALQVLALDPGQCVTVQAACVESLGMGDGISIERRLAALSELWLQRAQRAPDEEQAIVAWLESARHAYAYLFFSPRRAGDRAFEDRQTQVRDYYNYAVQSASIALFKRADWRRPDFVRSPVLKHGDWTILASAAEARQARARMPDELLAASALSFSGLRSVYRRDGFGSELLAIQAHDLDAGSAARPSLGRVGTEAQRPFSEMPATSLTMLFVFEGHSLDEVLATRTVRLQMHDPYHESSVALAGEQVPLAGNFTAGFGLWLARSAFAGQALRTLLGREQGIRRPHVYLMQPFDPERRVIILLHGLASSPEAWVNVANEVLGDESLRQNFQIWQVYYPTNAPMIVNQAGIRRAIAETFAHFDPDGRAIASRDIVLVGHSMGGVLARLLVSSSGDRLRDWLVAESGFRQRQFARVQERLRPLTDFAPLPGVSRAIFIAAPHRGTEVAGSGMVRWLASFIRLPLTLVENFNDTLQAALGQEIDDQRDTAGRPAPRLPTSLDNLDAHDSFIQAAIKLPIQAGLPYHSIIARADPGVPLAQADDGVVPYWSAHLDGAASELVITGHHSIQESARAVLEVRRILHEELASRPGLHDAGRADKVWSVRPARLGERPGLTTTR